MFHSRLETFTDNTHAATAVGTFVLVVNFFSYQKDVGHRVLFRVLDINAVFDIEFAALESLTEGSERTLEYFHLLGRQFVVVCLTMTCQNQNRPKEAKTPYS